MQFFWGGGSHELLQAPHRSDSCSRPAHAEVRNNLFKTLSAFHRTGVHHSLSSAEVPGGDGGLLHPVLREGHHRAVDHASEWYEVSAGLGGLISQLCPPFDDDGASLL